MTRKTLAMALMVGITVFGCTAFLRIPGVSLAVAGNIPQFTFDNGSTQNFEAGERYGFTHNNNMYVNTGNPDFDNGANGVIGVRRSMEESKRTSDLIHKQLERDEVRRNR